MKSNRRGFVDSASNAQKKANVVKAERDALNKDARGTRPMLEDFYQKDVISLLEKDLPLDLEKKLLSKPLKPNPPK